MLSPDFVKFCFGSALLITLVIVYIRRSAPTNDSSNSANHDLGADQRFQSFQRVYLFVYLSAMMADWLQGPYVYALYESYGFTRSDNAILFTAGFGSSAVFGTVIGSLADRLGRRRFAALYCILYAVSCTTKHFNSFNILMLGRVTGGVATSLLFSVFDSWMVAEHYRRGFCPDLLGRTFSLAVFGNSMVAILAGEVGQLAADMKELTNLREGSQFYFGGYCSPFDVAIMFLSVSLLSMSLLWSENYGQKSESGSGGSLAETIALAFRTIRQQPQVLHCGVVCSFFEASMFIFVFMWTPALTEEGHAKPPYGHIFASFMVMSMLGSQVFSMLLIRRSVEEIGCLTLATSVLCHIVPIFASDATLRFLSFLMFELCVGVYFPMMGTMKGLKVPEESRSAIYNLYRVPLNIIVVTSLVLKIELQTAFVLTSALLFTAIFFQFKLIGTGGTDSYRHAGSTKIATEFGLDDEVEGLSIKAEATIVGNIH